MDRTFNNGVGMIVVAAPHKADALLAYLKQRKQPASITGSLARGDRGVMFV